MELIPWTGTEFEDYAGGGFNEGGDDGCVFRGDEIVCYTHDDRLVSLWIDDFVGRRRYGE